MIKILIADDHPLIRTGLLTTLTGEEDLQVVGEAVNANEVQSKVLELSPDVLLLDLGMPGPSPAATVQFIQAHCPQVKILILTAYKDEIYVRDMIKMGVSGYVLKDEVPETLVLAIRTVMGGGAWLSQSVMQIISKQPAHQNRQDDLLTKREQDVLCLIAKGYSNGQIAKILDITEGTIKNHVVSLYQKLDIHSRAEAVIIAIKFVNSNRIESIEKLIEE